MANMVTLKFLFSALSLWRKRRGAQFFINLGPQVGFLLSDSEKIEDDWTYPPIPIIEQHGKNRQKFDYGIAGGLGLELNKCRKLC